MSTLSIKVPVAQAEEKFLCSVVRPEHTHDLDFFERKFSREVRPQRLRQVGHRVKRIDAFLVDQSMICFAR